MLAFFTNNRVSGQIRGVQPAQYLQRPLNPPDMNGYTCVFVKHVPPQGMPAGSFLDVLDGVELRSFLAVNRQIRPIAFTKSSWYYLSKLLRRRDLVFIPQHHCNFEREIRPPRDVYVVGYVGARKGLSFDGEAIDPSTWVKPFAEAGFEFRWRIVRGTSTRQEVVDFYRQLDIQVYARYIRYTYNRFKDSLKLINAGSFGIPTVAKLEQGELWEHVLPAASLEEMITQCVRLRDSRALYDDISGRVRCAAEAYHISKIMPLYLALE